MCGSELSEPHIRFCFSVAMAVFTFCCSKFNQVIWVSVHTFPPKLIKFRPVDLNFLNFHPIKIIGVACPPGMKWSFFNELSIKHLLCATVCHCNRAERADATRQIVDKLSNKLYQQDSYFHDEWETAFCFTNVKCEKEKVTVCKRCLRKEHVKELKTTLKKKAKQQ